MSEAQRLLHRATNPADRAILETILEQERELEEWKQQERYRNPVRIAAFMDTLHWAGVDIEDIGGRFIVHGDRTGLLQAEVDKRYNGIWEYWRASEAQP